MSTHHDAGTELHAGFARLQGREQSDPYFRQLCGVFEQLLGVLAGQSPDPGNPSRETTLTRVFLERLLYTIQVLRLGHTCDPGRGVSVDVTDSGFPGFMEIANLRTSLQRRDEQLRRLPPMADLKQALLDHLMERRDPPADLLRSAARRAFYEKLDAERLFLPFTPGLLERRPDNGDGAADGFVFSWACYDFASNRPYLHVLAFDRDAAAGPFDEGGADHARFLAAVEGEGGRAPKLGVIAVGLDEHLEDIHPKVLKRTCVGPLVARGLTETPADLHRLLEECDAREGEFILLFEDEVILSAEQVVSRSYFSSGKVREVFSIPETDLELYQRKASRVHKYMLLPHRVRQHMDLAGRHAAYADRTIITTSR